MEQAGPCRHVSLFRRPQIRDSARACTGRDRSAPPPFPRVVRLSALFVAVVQSCRRRCAVRRCSNRRRAIRNHASNLRWSSLAQPTNEPRTLAWRLRHPSRIRVCRGDRRTTRTLCRPSCTRWLSAWLARMQISRVHLWAHRWAP